jgi:hypothetical protein
MGAFVPEPREILAGDTLIAKAIQSQNFVSGSSGWQINAAGTAEFNNVTVRGDLITTGDNNSYVKVENSGGNVEIDFHPGDPGAGYTTIDGSVLASQTVAPNGFAILSFSAPIIRSNIGGVPAGPIINMVSQSVDLATPAYVDFNSQIVAPQLASKSYVLTTPIAPLVTTANQATTVLTGSFNFKSGYAYEIAFSTRYQFAGFTATASAEPRGTFGLHRINPAGTLIYQGGYTNASDTADFQTYQSMVVKVTAGDTTQTIALTGQYSSVAGTTSMTIPASPQQPVRMTIRCIGVASDHSDALELPTS